MRRPMHRALNDVPCSGAANQTGAGAAWLGHGRVDEERDNG